MKVTSFSGALVLGVSLAAAVGWAGQEVAPAIAARADRGLARDRSAWQPSPVPSLAQAAGVRHAPLAGDLLPAPLSGPAVRAAALPPPAGPKGVPLGTGIAPGVLPIASQLAHDEIEALAGGKGRLPDRRGTWRQVTFYSSALGYETTYMAWVPPGYGASRATGVPYPTLYLLHGVGSAEASGPEEWLGYALTEDLDRMLALELIEPMIVILPNGEQAFWMNHAGGGARWGDFVAGDLVTHVDATFRTDARRERRAIGGLSMGGHGALQLAYNFPDVFGVAGAHSPTLRPYEQSPEFFGDRRWFARHDPLTLARNGSAAGRVVTWIDVGDADRWRPQAEALAGVLAERKAHVELRVFEGEHEGWYWRTYLPEYLRFYSAVLHPGNGG